MSRQEFRNYLDRRNKPWKYADLSAKITEIISEDECNDTYGRGRIHAALKLKYPVENISGERTVYRIMERIGAGHPKWRICSAIGGIMPAEKRR